MNGKSETQAIWNGKIKMETGGLGLDLGHEADICGLVFHIPISTDYSHIYSFSIEQF